MATTGQAVSTAIERVPEGTGLSPQRTFGRQMDFTGGAKSHASSPPDWFRRVHPATWLLAVFLLFLPAFANDFIQLQVFGWAFVLGMIALSLMFLGGLRRDGQPGADDGGGMRGLHVRDLRPQRVHGDQPRLAVVGDHPRRPGHRGDLRDGLGSAGGAHRGIYTIMITLAIASAFFYFTRQNYTIFNGFSGFNAVKPPPLFGVDWKQATPFYYLSLFFATASYLVVLYVSRSSFGLALQGVRDNARRMEALGFNVTAHRIAAYSFAAVIAGVAGILLTWLNGQISPGTAGVGPVIDILIIAVVGGLRHPIGPFIGAIIYVVLRTFALDALVAVGLPPERFQLLIGLGFLLIVLFSPDGVLGLWERWRARLRLRRSDL